MVRKVLFVDDDQIMLLAVEKRFTAYSDYFTMLMANDGFEAVQKLKETSVSLIVLDLKMPRMDGMSLLSHTREKYPDIPVIIVSGYRTAEMYKLAKAKGVIAYISKPFQVDDLGKIIMSTLQKEANGGIMHNVSPTVFLQLMEMEGKTCTIRILEKRSGKGGILYFSEGKLLDARVGEIQGLDAAYRVFTWEEVTIFIQNECPARKNSINSDLQPIIMKAVGMKDEEEDLDSPSIDTNLSVAEKEVMADLHDELGSLDLPDEFFDSEELGEPIPASETQTSVELPVKSAVAEPPKKSRIDEIRRTLYREVGEKCGLEDIYHDDSMGNVVEFLTELGSMFNFGKLKVGYIDNGKESDRILLPGQPTIVLQVSQKCPQDKIIQVLNQYV
ncbi:MAG: response regulator [Desulfopila sp.]|jgi:CheY-like chemotaxis protein|nr:response regulator [Desulfopila sp.]